MDLTFSKKELAKIDVSNWGFIENLNSLGPPLSEEINAALREQFSEVDLRGAVIQFDMPNPSSIVIEVPLGADEYSNPEAKIKIIDLVKDFMEDMALRDEEDANNSIKILKTVLQRAIKILDGK